MIHFQLSFDAPFAEIEIGVKSPPASAAPQPVARRASDPVRRRFYEMRSLASGNPFGRNDAALFYKQAKLMEDITDDYGGFEPFFKYYPYYQQMGYEQLRTYFTWRTNVRKGETPPTSLSYIFLYIYELLSGVGADGPADGLDKLTALWTAYREAEPLLDRFLPQWFKDYHICYETPSDFAEFAAANQLQRYFPEAFYTTDDLLLWNGVSSYDVTKSNFYLAGNKDLLKDGFAAVLRGLRASGTDMERWLANSTAQYRWRPFEDALVHIPHEPRDRRVEMPGGEVYRRKDGQWTASAFIRDAGQKERVGYLIKKTEACLRQAARHKHRIKAGPGALDTLIEKAVKDFYADRNRTVVTVDHGNLARIRKEALGTQEKLAVPEEAPPVTVPPPPSAKTVEMEALAALLEGAVTLKEFAAGRGVMPEILADGINEKAVDYFGDNLLDDDMAIYGEYREKAKEMVNV